MSAINWVAGWSLGIAEAGTPITIGDPTYWSRGIGTQVLAMLGQEPAAAYHRALLAEAGHATPKVDVRGALFDEDDRVLLVQEKRDGRWTLPGGWADALDTPSQAAEREFAEEAGLRVRAHQLAMIHDGSRHNGHAASPWHIYKLMFLMERLDDAEPTAGLDEETSDVGFFTLDALPELSDKRTNAEQLALLLAREAVELHRVVAGDQPRLSEVARVPRPPVGHRGLEGGITRRDALTVDGLHRPPVGRTHVLDPDCLRVI
jgi:ADP-ribose pyrophosphatase YjhB (NUDIX family)